MCTFVPSRLSCGNIARASVSRRRTTRAAPNSANYSYRWTRGFHADDKKRNNVAVRSGNDLHIMLDHTLDSLTSLNLKKTFGAKEIFDASHLNQTISGKDESNQEAEGSIAASKELYHLGREEKFERKPYWNKISRYVTCHFEYVRFKDNYALSN